MRDRPRASGGSLEEGKQERERTRPFWEGLRPRGGEIGAERKDEGQAWADVEEMKCIKKERRGGGRRSEEREGVDRRGEEGGGGENPSPVEASSHEGLKVDGAGERWKEGQEQTEEERGVDKWKEWQEWWIGYGVMEGETQAKEQAG